MKIARLNQALPAASYNPGLNEISATAASARLFDTWNSLKWQETGQPSETIYNWTTKSFSVNDIILVEQETISGVWTTFDVSEGGIELYIARLNGNMGPATYNGPLNEITPTTASANLFGWDGVGKFTQADGPGLATIYNWSLENYSTNDIIIVAQESSNDFYVPVWSVSTSNLIRFRLDADWPRATQDVNTFRVDELLADQEAVTIRDVVGEHTGKDGDFGIALRFPDTPSTDPQTYECLMVERRARWVTATLLGNMTPDAADGNVPKANATVINYWGEEYRHKDPVGTIQIVDRTKLLGYFLSASDVVVAVLNDAVNDPDGEYQLIHGHRLGECFVCTLSTGTTGTKGVNGSQDANFTYNTITDTFWGVQLGTNIASETQYPDQTQMLTGTRGVCYWGKNPDNSRSIKLLNDFAVATPRITQTVVTDIYDITNNVYYDKLDLELPVGAATSNPDLANLFFQAQCGLDFTGGVLKFDPGDVAGECLTTETSGGQCKIKVNKNWSVGNDIKVIQSIDSVDVTVDEVADTITFQLNYTEATYHRSDCGLIVASGGTQSKNVSDVIQTCDET